MAGAPGTVAVPASLSVAARLDQLHAAIRDAHEIVDGLTPRSTDQGQPDQAAGVEATLDRCQAEMQQLNDRLREVRDRVGQL